MNTVYENFNNLTSGRYYYTNVGEPEASYTGPATSHQRLRKGVRRKKIPGAPPTDYSLFDLKRSLPFGYGTQTIGKSPWRTTRGRHNNFAEHTFDSYFGVNVSGIPDGNLSDIARLSALSKLDRRDMDLGTAWKERGKTADLIKGVAGTAVRSLQAIKRRDGRQLLNELGLDHSGARGRGFVDAYLAYHYGMKPFLKDVAGAVDTLTRIPESDWFIRARGTTFKSYEGKTTGMSAGNAYKATCSAYEGARYTVVAERRQLSREDDLRWASGLDNPLGTAWEITPWSFVADWIVPVGDWLQALNSVKYYKSWDHVLSHKITQEVLWAPHKGTFGGITYDSRFAGKRNLVVVSRKCTTGIPIIGLPIKDPVSIDHMAKALSLLASLAANSAELPRFIRY